MTTTDVTVDEPTDEIVTDPVENIVVEEEPTNITTIPDETDFEESLPIFA